MIGRSFRVSKVPYGTKYSCNTCHTNGGGTPRNPFGLDLESQVTPNGFRTQESPNPGDQSLVTHPGIPDDTPTKFTIFNNYPNPFNPIQYGLSPKFCSKLYSSIKLPF